MARQRNESRGTSDHDMFKRGVTKKVADVI